MVVWCTQNLRRNGCSFMWHQPCQRFKYTTSVDIQKTRYKKLVTHVEPQASAVSLLKRAENSAIQVIINQSSIALRHLPQSKFKASLSGTIPKTQSIALHHLLQTLPNFVTPLMGHSVSPCSCPPTLSAPSGRLGTNTTVEATQRPSTHVNMRRVRPG